MIHREGGDEYCVSCDWCSWEDFFDGDFYDVIDDIKAGGWKIGKDKDDEWTHKCPDCVAEGK